MSCRKNHLLALTALFAVTLPMSLPGQVNRADYARAQGVREKYRGLVRHLPEQPQWIDGTEKYVYRRTVAGGHEFVLVDAEKLTRQPAFDHARLAAELSKQAGKSFQAATLPFSQAHLDAELKTLEFELAREHWRCDLTAYSCTHEPLPPEPPPVPLELPPPDLLQLEN